MALRTAPYSSTTTVTESLRGGQQGPHLTRQRDEELLEDRVLVWSACAAMRDRRSAWATGER